MALKRLLQNQLRMLKALTITDEELEFQRKLDDSIDDHFTRTVFADYLEECGDVRAAGYRVLGLLQRRPSLGYRVFSPPANWYWVAADCIDTLCACFHECAGEIHIGCLHVPWCKALRMLYRSQTPKRPCQNLENASKTDGNQGFWQGL